MSLYNNIEKIKYSKATSEVINLKEYIVFENERKQEKYVVFKFVNNVSQQLLGMEFEVFEYNIDGDIVESTVVVYDKPLAGPNAEFVPNAKLKVNYACKTISVKLHKAAYDRFLWKEGEYEDNSYKFEHFHRDEQSRGTAPAAPAKKERIPNPPRKKPQKVSGKKFELKNQTKKNIARFPAVFLAFVFIAASVFVGVSLYFFKDRSKRFTLQDYKLRLVDATAKTVSIYGYVGEDDELVIPGKIGDYTVTRIQSGAFKDCKATSITINVDPSANGWYYIEKEVFVNCKNLSYVYSEGEIIVACTKAQLCKGCSPEIRMSNATFYSETE